MKASIVSLVFTAALAAAQDLSGLPSCATTCVLKFTTGTAIGGCQQLDIGCICKNADFLNGIACCLAGACDKADQDTAVSYAQQICSTAGVKTPDQVVCKDSSSSQAESATDNSASSKTTGSSDSSTTGSSDSSTTSADSSSAPASTNSGSTTAASTGSSAKTTTGSATKSAASTTSSNVAAPLASAGSLVGAAIAMLAAAL